jgi:hypothetical protein
MIDIKIGDDLPKDKPYLIIGEEKVIVFADEAEKQDYFDELIKNQPIEDEIVE